MFAGRAVVFDEQTCANHPHDHIRTVEPKGASMVSDKHQGDCAHRVPVNSRSPDAVAAAPISGAYTQARAQAAFSSRG